MAKNTPAQQIFDLLVSRDFDPEMLDVEGMPAPDPSQAELFNFDFRAESGKDYGTVVILLGADNNLEVYFGDNVGRTMEGADKDEWYQFLEQLKLFAVKNFMSFSPKNINRLRYSMQGQAAIKEGLFESWTGTKTQSWNGCPTEARLMIRHKRTLGENDARYRYIESLFIETAEGERYKLPFTKLSGGRAMVEHVRMGGRPYDIRGQHIAEIVEELNVLSRFRRANQGKIFEGDTAQLVEQTNAYYETAQRTLKSLSTNKGYTKYFESWNPAEITEQEVVIEGLKHLFVTQSIDTRIESALPLLAKIQQQGNAMKEANIFEAWAESLVEGTWQLPDTPEKQTQLIELMQKDLPVGADATNATELLYGLLGDDHLFDQLEALAERDANADARQLVYDRMQELGDHPEVRKVMDQLQIDDKYEMNPPEATNPADLEPQEPVQEGDLEDCDSIGGDAADALIKDTEVPQRKLAESRMLDEDGSKLEHILDRFKHEVRNFEQGGDLDEHLYDALFDYYQHTGDMPYDIIKHKSGDPYEWVAQNLESHLRGGGIVGGMPDEDYSLERESVMHGDYAEESVKDPYTQTEDPAGTLEPAYPEYQDPLAKILTIAGVPAPERPAPDYEKELSEEELDELSRRDFLKGAGAALGGAALAGLAGQSQAAPGDIDPGRGFTQANADQKKTTQWDPLVNYGDKILKGPGTPNEKIGSMYGYFEAVRRQASIDPTFDDQVKKLGASIRNDKQAMASAQNLFAQVTKFLTQMNIDYGGLQDPQSGLGKQLVKEISTKYQTFLQNPTSYLNVYSTPGLREEAQCNMTEAGESCPVHGMEECWGSDSSPLAGKYGHSGKLKAVDKNLSFLDRLKELSGMKK